MVRICLLLVAWSLSSELFADEELRVTETDDRILVETSDLEAAINKRGYVSGVYRQTFLDKRTGFRDPGAGLDIADWILEPGSDASYRDALDVKLIYRDDPALHGKSPKRILEGPQICTHAGELEPEIVRGQDFVAVKQQFRYYLAAPGKKIGSLWTQWMVFPKGKRYFISMQQIDAVNDSQAMALRIDMPGHIRHTRGDTFEQVYLSYYGDIAASEFFENFAPDEKFHYVRGTSPPPDRYIRAYRLRDRQTGALGPWLAGMTLDSAIVSEAWCHQRGYVCMIEEFGGRPIKSGESFNAAFIVGYFDDKQEMNAVYDAHRGFTRLEVTTDGWRLTN